eukprot:c2883_g1_i1 orf=3-242(-)
MEMHAYIQMCIYKYLRHSYQKLETDWDAPPPGETRPVHSRKRKRQELAQVNSSQETHEQQEAGPQASTRSMQAHRTPSSL